MAITLYSLPSPNGLNVSILLELLGLEYTVTAIDIRTNVQKEGWFLELNPNGKVPVLVDTSTNTTLSETAAILQYLADTYDQEHRFLYAAGTPEYYRQLEATYFHMSGLGPMQTQRGYLRKTKDQEPESFKRFCGEVDRLYGVLEERLKRNEHESSYLVGNRLSIADVLVWPWAATAYITFLDKEQFPRVVAWVKKVYASPEVRKGARVPPSDHVEALLSKLDE